MTVHRPVVTDNAQRIKECTKAELDGIHQRIAYLYAQNIVAQLSVVSSGGNISPTMTDTRYKSGTAKRNTSGNWPAVTTFPSESQTGEPELVTTTYDKVSQTVNDPGASPTYSIKPVYVDGNSGVREMTEADVIDTFIAPVVTNIENGTSGGLAGGAYFLSTSSSISNCTNLGAIFTDTKANLSAYTSGQIGTANTYQDHFTSTNYNLFRNNGVNASYRRPLVIDYTTNNYNNPAGLREMTNTEFGNYFEQQIQKYIYDETGYILRYNFDGTGTTKGTAIVNNVLTGVTGNYTTRKATANDYRAQEFPNGTNQANTIHRLKVERT